MYLYVNMTKSTNTEHAKRLNAARALLSHEESGAPAVALLAARFQVSQRQAYRYLQHARLSPTSLSSPEDKKAVTVKLPISLTERLRMQAQQSGCTISDLVADALRHSSDRSKDGGS